MMNQYLLHQQNLLSNQLFYHKLDIRVSPTDKLYLDSWIGSVIKNGLLNASNYVMINEEVSLFSLIETIPIDATHPFYRELSKWFPKGFSISGLPYSYAEHLPMILHQGEVFTFSLCLFGRMAEYYNYFIEAIREMCLRGIGKPIVALQLIDICESHPEHSSGVITIGNSTDINALKYPITLDRFLTMTATQKWKCKDMLISFETPVNLVYQRTKAEPIISFQTLQNGFPSFYQLIRSLTYRLLKLVALYTSVNKELFHRENLQGFEEWLENAAEPTLVSANIHWVMIPDVQKKESKEEFKLGGYMGDMTYSGDFDAYLPILLFFQDLGIGTDVVYGLGQYRIENS